MISSLCCDLLSHFHRTCTRLPSFSLAPRMINSGKLHLSLSLKLLIPTSVQFGASNVCLLATHNVQPTRYSHMLSAHSPNGGLSLSSAPAYCASVSTLLIFQVTPFVVVQQRLPYKLAFHVPTSCALDAGNLIQSIVTSLLLLIPPIFSPYPDSYSLRLAPQHLRPTPRYVLVHIHSRNASADVEDWVHPPSASSARLHFEAQLSVLVISWNYSWHCVSNAE